MHILNPDPTLLLRPVLENPPKFDFCSMFDLKVGRMQWLGPLCLHDACMPEAEHETCSSPCYPHTYLQHILAL
ncbi:hypothetical protein ACN38_g2615 [Penicillium nordicum]|uniref:Uncharacterized protein n=1 Tax=Penicillium nordicum TaxID=229535 RepID=A0A0M9WIP8_9EURO|nr:hypothetical protein ACN38_g2615 [Penicillium nordicum]